MFPRFLTLALVCLSAILSSHGAEEFELAGEITFKRFQNNKQQRQVDSRFTLQKRGAEWLVATVTEKSASNWVAIAIRSDGASNMFEVCSNLTSKASVATMLPGFIPIGCTDITVPYLWLAYASHDYLATVTNHLVSPFHHLSQENMLNPIFLLPAIWQTNSIPPYGLDSSRIIVGGD